MIRAALQYFNKNIGHHLLECSGRYPNMTVVEQFLLSSAEPKLSSNINTKSICVDDGILVSKKIQRSDCQHCSLREKMLFAPLEMEKLSSWLWPINHMICEPKTRIYYQGQPSQSVFSLRRGFIKLTQLNKNGDEKIIRLLGPGSCIGLEALTKKTYGQTAEALTEIDFCTIPIKVIIDLEKEQPIIFHSLIEQWQQQLDEANQWLGQLFTGTIKQRLCRFILMQQQMQRMPNDQILLISNQDIASVLATSDETVSRCLSTLRSSGVLELVGKRIYRVKMAEIKQIAAD